MPVGNEGAGVVIRTGSSDAAKALMGKTVAMIGGAMYAQYRSLEGDGMSAAARRHHAGRRRVLVRQSADRARHDRDHAARRPQGAGAYRGRLQSRPDAQQDLHQGRHRPRQYRAQQGAGRHPAQDRRQTCRRFHRRYLHGRPDRRAGGNRRDASRSMPSAAASSPAKSSPAWRSPPTRPPRNTAATARACTSRSISTAASTSVRPS